MADNITSAERSRVMRCVRSVDTRPERMVRSIVHRLGYRFRLHVRELPGTPDMVLARLRTVIEVRGCFWHGHACGQCRIPATRRGYWLDKIERNRRRNARTSRALRRAGWSVLVVWECETRQPQRLSARLARLLARSLP
ncbi:MAG: DNA mismatch endonuclease Vsr [Pirellulales bacterium]|nr:DNA mismatch endonuclease Vsr [Pirellulales bacterium]